MRVYLSPSSRTGFQGTATVDRSGGFKVDLPKAALDSRYKVKATKRINITLTNGADTIKICYNFAAVDRSVLFSERENPIILDSFVTTITAYECALENGGLTLPTRDGSESLKLKPGMTKAEAISVMGTTGLFVESSTRWCWTGNDVLHSNCSALRFDLCQCALTFSEAGLVSTQDNVNGSLLDILHW
jgi:hypothetical protein